MNGKLHGTVGSLLAILILTNNSILSEDCFSDGQAYIYRGTINTTKSGRTCQRWDVTSPHNPNYPMTSEHVNFCRSPDNDDVPWCYTTDPYKRWEYCAVPLCSTTTVSSTFMETTKPTKLSTELSIVSSDLPTELSTDLTTELSTVSTDLTTELSTDLTTELSTDLTTELSTGLTTELSTGLTTNLPTYISTEVLPLTSTASTYQNVSNICVCECSDRKEFWVSFYSSNLTDSEKQIIIETEKKRLHDLLIIDKKTLKAYVRGRSSARDDRRSSFSIGVLGIGIIISLCGFIVLLDLTSLCQKRT